MIVALLALACAALASSFLVDGPIPAAAASACTALALVLRIREATPAAAESRGGEETEPEPPAPGDDVPAEPPMGLAIAAEVPPDPAGTDDMRDIIHRFRALAPRIDGLARHLTAKSEEAATKTTKSAFSIAENAKGASSKVASLLKTVTSAETGLGGRMVSLGNELGRFDGIIGEIEGVRAAYARDQSNIDALAGKIIDHTKAIEDIAERTGVLSINASIEAARSGAHGRGFTVIAQEIRKLSDTTGEITGNIADILRDFDRTVTRSLEERSADLRQTLGHIVGIRDIMRETTDLLAPQVSSVSESIEEAESLTDSVSSELAGITVWFQTQDALRQIIEHINGAIHDLLTDCESACRGDIPEECEKRAERALTDRFTVDDEWEALGLEPPVGSGTNVTLF